MRQAPIRTLISPVLVGREDQLAALDATVDASRSGRGALVLVSGEAGVGKTRLVTASLAAAERRGVRAVRADAFAGDAEQPGSLLLDLARSLEAQGWAAAAARFRAALEEAVGKMEAGRRRRVIVERLVAAVLDLGEAGPLVAFLEDLHWTDDLTLDVLARAARRLGTTPLVIWATFRTDELAPSTPMRRWRADLLARRDAIEIAVPRLTRDEVAAMTAVMIGDSLPAPAILVARLLERTDGVPLYIEELLSASSSAAIADARVPDTLADAVIQRAAHLTHDARDVANAAAVIGRSFTLPLLTRATTLDPDRVLNAIDELRDRHFARSVQGTHAFDFRHALIRDALYEALPLGTRIAIHRRVADTIRESGVDGRERALAWHLEQAGDLEEASGFAVKAAQMARGLSSHREAASLYQQALRTLPPGNDRRRARLLAEYGRELVATDENVAAAEVLSQARALLLVGGDRVEAAELVPTIVAARHLQGDDIDKRARLLRDALTDVDPAGEAARAPRARILAGLAAAYMLDRQLEEAERHGDEALVVSRAVGDELTEINVIATLGVVHVFAGRMDAGWALFEESLERARVAQYEAEAARTFRMVGSCASVLVEYERGEHWLREGIAYAERVELWNHRHYMAAHLAHVLWATGRLEEAEGVAKRALADGREGITTRITALYVLGYIHLERGELSAATALLDEALAAAGTMRELQRVSPPLWGLAEVALAKSDTGQALHLCRRARAESERVGDAAYLFPFLTTGTRALIAGGDMKGAREWAADVGGMIARRAIPGTLPAVAHASGLIAAAERRSALARRLLTEALEGWRSRRRVRSAREAERDLAKGVARPAGWAPLTAREFEVAQFVAIGLTNGQIADRLVLAPRTVASHVEHILAKIGAARRAEVAAWITRREREASREGVGSSAKG
ncbi:MAG TPA: AAA family ATPase [Candidatus Limnocylindria bacterium]|nr:AAA family ATPase [Candidatus Limnocylindria bacterium]